MFRPMLPMSKYPTSVTRMSNPSKIRIYRKRQRIGTRQSIPFSIVPFDIKPTSSFNLTENIDTTITTIKQNYLARLEIKRQLALTNLLNTTINQKGKNSVERIKLIVSFISKQDNEPNFNSQTNLIASTDWSLLRTPEKDFLAASAIFETHQRNFYGQQLTDLKKKNRTDNLNKKSPRNDKKEIKNTQEKENNKPNPDLTINPDIELTRYSLPLPPGPSSSFRSELWGINPPLAAIQNNSNITIFTNSQIICNLYIKIFSEDLSPRKRLRTSCC
jgi:hypothetical protein